MTNQLQISVSRVRVSAYFILLMFHSFLLVTFFSPCLLCHLIVWPKSRSLGLDWFLGNKIILQISCYLAVSTSQNDKINSVLVFAHLRFFVNSGRSVFLYLFFLSTEIPYCNLRGHHSYILWYSVALLIPITWFWI